MDVALLITIKVSECKLGLFDHTPIISKLPTGLVYIGNIINYLLYLPDSFSKGLEVDLEGNNTFITPMLSMHIDRLGLVTCVDAN